MHKILIGIILGAATTVALSSIASDPQSACLAEAQRVWNDATLNEPIEVERGDRRDLSVDGRDAFYWMTGCRQGFRLALVR